MGEKKNKFITDPDDITPIKLFYLVNLVYICLRTRQSGQKQDHSLPVIEFDPIDEGICSTRLRLSSRFLIEEKSDLKRKHFMNN